MDKTLQDYIDRTLEEIKKDKEPLHEPKENKDQYPVLPEDDGTDSKRNPYGNH